jgi:hypothetical protein
MDDAMHDLITQFPHEFCIVTLRSLELGAASSTLLVSHCAYLLWRHYPPASAPDTGLLLAGLLRVALFLPRPCLWLAMRRQLQRARCQPTPQRVARRLQRLLARPQRAEQALAAWFYCWLGGLALALWVLPPTPLTAALWQHVQCNAAALVLVRLASGAGFIWLQGRDLQRGVTAGMLEAHTTLAPYAGSSSSSSGGGGSDGKEEEECAICYAAFEPGADALVRTLACRHFFHQKCVDEWLLQKQNTCPLCLKPVGPGAEEEGEDEEEDEDGAGEGKRD